MARAFVAVGSNLDPARHVPRALELLARRVRVTAVSTFYRTPPLERPEQPPYANGVVACETDLAPEALRRDVLRGVEAALGRARASDRHAARVIDLDLAVYLAPGLEHPPDPDVSSRAFVALPLLELAPDLALPVTGEPLRAVAARLPPSAMEPLPDLTRFLRASLLGSRTVSR